MTLCDALHPEKCSLALVILRCFVNKLKAQKTRESVSCTCTDSTRCWHKSFRHWREYPIICLLQKRLRRFIVNIEQLCEGYLAVLRFIVRAIFTLRRFQFQTFLWSEWSRERKYFSIADNISWKPIKWRRLYRVYIWHRRGDRSVLEVLWVPQKSCLLKIALALFD